MIRRCIKGKTSLQNFVPGYFYLCKSDIHLNFRLNVGGNTIHRRHFKELTNRTVLGACATLASNR